MRERVENTARETVQRAQHLASKAQVETRQVLDRAADFVTQTKEPARRVTDTGLKLNQVYYDSMARLLRFQLKAVEQTVDAGAQRLRRMAEAESFKGLVTDQIQLFPAARERVVGDIREIADIFKDAGTEIADVVGDWYAPKKKRTVQKPRTRKATSRKKTAAKKKITKKNATKKAA